MAKTKRYTNAQTVTISKEDLRRFAEGHYACAGGLQVFNQPDVETADDAYNAVTYYPHLTWLLARAHETAGQDRFQPGTLFAKATQAAKSIHWNYVEDHSKYQRRVCRAVRKAVPFSKLVALLTGVA